MIPVLPDPPSGLSTAGPVSEAPLPAPDLDLWRADAHILRRLMQRNAARHVLRNDP